MFNDQKTKRDKRWVDELMVIDVEDSSMFLFYFFLGRCGFQSSIALIGVLKKKKGEGVNKTMPPFLYLFIYSYLLWLFC